MSIIVQQELQPDSALVHIKNQYVNITTVAENCSLESKDISHDDFLKILSFISSPLNKILEESSIESIDEMIEHLIELDDTGSDEHELRQTKSKLQHIMTVSESVNRSFAGVF